MRARTRCLPADSAYGAVEFLSTTLPADNDVPFAASGSSTATNAVLLSPARDAVLGLPDAARLVARVCAELERMGVATPFVFFALALDVRCPAVARLVRAFLATCQDSNSSSRNNSQERWAKEARFAGAHELGICLRWGLLRVVRVEGGREVRRLLNWAWYQRWRAEEAGECFSIPPSFFCPPYSLSLYPSRLPPFPSFYLLLTSFGVSPSWFRPSLIPPLPVLSLLLWCLSRHFCRDIPPCGAKVLRLTRWHSASQLCWHYLVHMRWHHTPSCAYLVVPVRIFRRPTLPSVLFSVFNAGMHDPLPHLSACSLFPCDTPPIFESHDGLAGVGSVRTCSFFTSPGAALLLLYGPRLIHRLCLQSFWRRCAFFPSLACAPRAYTSAFWTHWFVRFIYPHRFAARCDIPGSAD
ncbi:hypothetical protein C8R44DRAFT_992255 [Mycena epipterygia]|nr:hypothetical protein C8R44DRAFT_992255 [Mycena epipterygia]